LEIGGNPTQGEMHHCLRGGGRPYDRGAHPIGGNEAEIFIIAILEGK